MIESIITIGAFITGLFLGWFARTKFSKDVSREEINQLNERLTQSLQKEAAAVAKQESAEQRVVEERERLVEVRTEMEQNFKAMAGSVIQKNSELFLNLAGNKFQDLTSKADQKLDEKKKLIDQNLNEMGQTLKGLAEQSIKLNANISENKLETEKLRDTTVNLREILSSSQQRGQWGERMVEDILQLLGLLENVNYRKQVQVESGEKPDFTFLLPRDKILNMDVKFPLAHYERFLSSEEDINRNAEKDLFLKDVRKHIKAVAGRAYINPNEGTVDYVMLFIPNESIYGFINKEDPGLIDFALKQKVLLCSPLTLYAVLSLIHQASRNFAMEQKANEVLQLLDSFRQQWDKYSESMDKMGRRISDAQKEFQNLSTTRTRMLEKPLLKIDELTQHGELLEESI